MAVRRHELGDGGAGQRPDDAQQPQHRLHHLDGLTIDELSALKRVHRSTIARRIARCCELLATNTHARLVERLGLPPSQVDSVMRLVRSQLELSLERWLGGNTTPRR